ncbi:MAG: Crp/Fnr family transcriptional regulator [Chloroflexota bacterium]
MTGSFKTTFSQLAHFTTLPDEVLDQLSKIAVRQTIPAGKVIYWEGEPAEAVYLLEEGWVKATRLSRKGREQAMMVLRPVDLFGDIAVFTEGVYPGTVTALEDVTVWSLSARHLQDGINLYPDLANAFLRHFAYRVLHYLQLVEDLSLHSVEARLARTLVRYAQSVDDQWVVPRRPWATYDEMAARLGTVRDVLSRALKTLEAKGYLRVEKHGIILLERQLLAEYEDL